MPDHLSLEQTDLVTALVRLRDKTGELVVRATTEGPSGCPWLELADVLDTAARLCRNQVVVDGTVD